MVLFFSISSFFINKNSQGRKLSAKKIPSSGNSALMQIILYEHTSAFAHPSLIAQRIQYDPNRNHPIDFFNSATYICTSIMGIKKVINL